MKITCHYINHKNKECILLKADYNVQLNKIFRGLDYAKYSNTHKGWYIPKSKELLQQVIQQTKDIVTIDLKLLHRNTKEQSSKIVNDYKNNLKQNLSIYNIQQLELFIQTLILKGYSPSTIKTYKNEFTIYLQTINKVKADSLNTKRIKDYLQYCFDTLKISENSIHSRMNALKFYYEQVLKKEKFFWEIPRPKKQLILPKVISEEKIYKYLFAVENLKHKTILLLAYSAGLRVSEVVNLKLEDINSDRMQIFVKSGKGKKDRLIPLSNTILLLLREYYNIHKPKLWLFEGQIKGMPYSARSAQMIFKAACSKLLLPKNVGFHSLRHSYATHLLDGGTDVKYIQSLLGHNDIKTTLRYLHVTNKSLGKIESPLDKIARKFNSN